jgi:hypothetical protein
MHNVETEREYTDAEFEAEIIDGEIEMLSKMIHELLQKQQELDLNLVKLRTVRDRLMSTVGENAPMPDQPEQFELPFEVVTD